jgi:hypothetical protein
MHSPLLLRLLPIYLLATTTFAADQLTDQWKFKSPREEIRPKLAAAEAGDNGDTVLKIKTGRGAAHDEKCRVTTT